MKSSLHFTLGGVSSKTMGVVNVHETGGLFHEQLSTPFNLEYNTHETTGYVSDSYYEYQPFEFTLHLYFETRNQMQLRVLVNWLFQKEFTELMFYQFPHRLLLVKTKNIGEITHNGLNHGIIPVTFVTHAPYFVSKIERTDPERIQATFGGTQIQLLNEGDVELSPTVRVRFDNYVPPLSRFFSIQNLSNDSSIKIEDIKNGEQLYIHGEKRIIHSSDERIGSYAGARHDGNWFYLSPANFQDNTGDNGNNILEVRGEGNIQFEYRHKYYTIY